MKISEVIAELEKIKRESGDINVYIKHHDDGFDYYTDEQFIGVEEREKFSEVDDDIYVVFE